MNSKDVGNVSESYVIARCLELGWNVLIPFGDNYPYDMVIDRGDGFKKIQVKTGHYTNGCIVAKPKKTIWTKKSAQTGKGQYVKYKSNEVDIFAIYSSYTKNVYFINFVDVSKSQGEIRLRIDQPKRHGSRKNIKWAKDYIV